jgi:cell division protein FtsW
LLLEPDFGATVVILVTSMVMLFLAGARLWPFIAMLAGVLVSLGVLAISSPYRLARLTSFLKPWEHQFDGGYQLTQSLIAFGRGGFFGVGLGKSVQKLFYLPEAHTDFLLAVLAEEFGLVGVLIIISLYIIIVFRALTIGKNAQTVKQHFSAFIAYGIAMWISVQVLVSFGVNSGLLPTKGLTLPLLSYGGSSVVIIFIALAILLRIDYESKYQRA